MFYPTLYRADGTSLWDEMFKLGRSSQSLQPWTPVVDVKETDNEIVVTAELAGIDPADVSVTVENGMLTISGEKKEEVESRKDDANYHLYERRYGRFERSFTLPRAVISDDVRAEFANGLLTVTLPKTPEAKPRRIQIKGANGRAAA